MHNKKIIRDYTVRYVSANLLTAFIFICLLVGYLFYDYRLEEIISEDQHQDLIFIEALEFIFMFIGLGLLVVQMLFIYRPMGKKLEQTLKLLDKEHSELSEVKNQLETNDDRYRLAIGVTKFGIWDWDIKINTLFWSDPLKNMLGIDDRDFRSTLEDFTSRVHADDINRVMQEAQAHLDRQAPFDTQYRVLKPDGSYIWVQARGQAMWDDNGKPVRMAGSMENITDKQEEYLKSKLFQSGIEAASLSVAIIDMIKPGRRFIYVSPSLAEMTGFSLDKLLNGNLNMLIGPDTEMGLLDKIDTTLLNAQPLKIEILNYRANGESFRNRLLLAPVFDTQNKLIAFVSVHHDMSFDILRERRELSRQRMESLGTLSGNVAHEINNLLVPMLMARDIIEPELKPDADPYALEHLEQVVQYAEQAAAIVKGILGFARKEPERRDVIQAGIALSQAFQFATPLVRNDIQITTSIADDVKNLPIQVNLTELRQMLTNFISNADYALRGKPDGQISITARLRKLNHAERSQFAIAQNDVIELSIKDNGMGIPAATLDRIFEPLFTTKPIGEGTGLGLSVVHGIMRSMGGAIDVESVQGKGTEFMLLIPVYYAPDDIELYTDLLDEWVTQNG